MDLKTAMMNRIISLKDKALWDYSLKMSFDSLCDICSRHDLKRIDHVYLVGCGTSLANAQIGESFIEGIAHLQAEAMPAFNFSEYLPAELLDEHKLVLGVTGAGVTTSVEQSLKFARECGALTISVTGSREGKCSKQAEEIVMTDALNEGPTVRTISNIFLQLGLYAIAIVLGEQRGVVDAAKRGYWDGELDKLIAGVPAVLELKEQIVEVANKYNALKGEMVFVLGTGPNYGTAWEGSLMAAEMAWIDAAGYEMEEFTHGRFRETDERKPMIFIAPHGKSYSKFVSILAECNKATTPAVVITDVVTDEIKKYATDIFQMPGDIDEVLTPLLYVFPMWLFDYYTGIARGVDPAGVRYGITAVDINRASI